MASIRGREGWHKCHPLPLSLRPRPLYTPLATRGRRWDRRAIAFLPLPRRRRRTRDDGGTAAWRPCNGQPLSTTTHHLRGSPGKVPPHRDAIALHWVRVITPRARRAGDLGANARDRSNPRRPVQRRVRGCDAPRCAPASSAPRAREVTGL